MKIRILTTFFIVFIHTFSFSQVTDSTRIESKIKRQKIIDSISKSAIFIDSTKVFLDTTNKKEIDSLVHSEYISVKKTLLDSLLKPYYAIHIDSVKNDTLVNAEFHAKYRVYIDAFTKDTSYIPLPKVSTFLSIKRKLVIDTLKIINPIKPVKIDTTKLADDPIWWKNRNSFGLDINEATF